MKVPEKLLKQVKDSIRIKNEKLDGTIQADIEAGALDLRRVGIVALNVKAEEDFQGKGEQYRRSYEGLRDALSLDGEYREKRAD